MNTAFHNPESDAGDAALLMIYSPKGDTKEFIGWIGLGPNQTMPGIIDLVMIEVGQPAPQRLNKKVVIKNVQTGIVIYNPRAIPEEMNGEKEFIGRGDRKWLKDNPYWPAILELWGQPTESEGDNGIFT